MPRERLSKYRWPATALSAADMAILYTVRESSKPRIPISALIAQAIRAQYKSAVLPIQQPEPMILPKAAYPKPPEYRSQMKRVQSLVLAMVIAGLLVGCDEEQLQDPLARLYRANQELSRQVEAQSRVIFVMGAAVILLGAGLAVSLGVLWKKGGRPSATTTAEPAVD